MIKYASSLNQPDLIVVLSSNFRRGLESDTYISYGWKTSHSNKWSFAFKHLNFKINET
jgi:hypothetical protein